MKRLAICKIPRNSPETDTADFKLSGNLAWIETIKSPYVVRVWFLDPIIEMYAMFAFIYTKDKVSFETAIEEYNLWDSAKFEDMTPRDIVKWKLKGKK
jgi:hypothetical protein